MKDFDEVLVKLQDEVESREMEEEVRTRALISAFPRNQFPCST